MLAALPAHIGLARWWWARLPAIAQVLKEGGLSIQHCNDTPFPLEGVRRVRLPSRDPSVLPKKSRGEELPSMSLSIRAAGSMSSAGLFPPTRSSWGPNGWCENCKTR